MSDGLESLYSAEIRTLAETVREDHRLANPDTSVTRKSPLCGSQVTLDVRLDGEGRIAELGHEVRACALGESVTALVLKIAPGCSREEIFEAAQAFRALLKNAEPMPDGPWKELDIMAPAHRIRSRHRSALLPFEVLLMAFGQIAGGGGA